MGMVRGGGYLALPLGTPSRGAVGPRPTEGLPDFGLLPIGKREGDVKKTPVIPPKGTRRQINESWYAAVALSEATWESVPLPIQCVFHLRRIEDADCHDPPEV